MSDFDREAERERLREKYENDRRKRQSTQRMSELLLKGATMTNRHCEECGDPIFRHEGTEFCPTCRHDGTAADEEASAGADAEGATDEGDADAQARADADAVANADADADAPAEANANARSDGPPASASDADESGGGTADAGGRPAPSAAREDRQPAAPTEGADRAGGGAPVPDRAGDEGRRPDRAPSGPTAAAGAEGGRATARASLERTLVRFARAAEGTEDPRRARDLLAAAREAAEALAALDRR